MNSAELGRKIKEARIARKMTQSEVVGDFITRNMLSQIESGSATPSVKTLEYLSRVLDVPLFQLIPDQKDQKEDTLYILEKAKSFLTEGSYDKILEMEESYPAELYDEFSAIFSQACLKLAKQYLVSQSYPKAVWFSQKSMEYAEKGIYANATVKSESIIILNEAAEKLSQDINNNK